jgi:hypothetical protein
MTYLPLFKASVHGKINKWTVEVKDNKFRTISGYSDGIQTFSEWTICEGKNIGKKNNSKKIWWLRNFIVILSYNN